MRNGTLSDLATVELYEAGESMIALCVREGMTPGGMQGRIARGRKARGYTVRRTPESYIVDSLAAVDAALRELERAIRRMERQRGRAHTPADHEPRRRAA
jgi:hypothetical protein